MRGEMKAAIGRIVHYKVAEDDVDLQSNGVRAGDLLPAMIVRVSAHAELLNLQIFIDGALGRIWRTSISRGDEPGQWSWPLVIFEMDPARVAAEEAASGTAAKIPDAGPDKVNG